MSEGSSTNLKCLHCGKGYCAACLHGDGGKMESLVKCSSCGKKPRTLGNTSRGGWKADAASPVRAGGASLGATLGTGISDADASRNFSSALRAESKHSPASAKRGVSPGRRPPTSPGVRPPTSPGLGASSSASSSDVPEMSASEVESKVALIYDYYCKYAPESTSIDNVKWFKCINELGLIDSKKITKAEVDLTFTKAKMKGERRINFPGFYNAMTMIATKKYPSRSSELSALSTLLTKANPLGAIHNASGTDTSGVYSRLTNASLYTGSHKNRFDESGQGLGLAGRDSIAKGDLSQMTRTHLNSQGGSLAPAPRVSTEGENFNFDQMDKALYQSVSPNPSSKPKVVSSSSYGPTSSYGSPSSGLGVPSSSSASASSPSRSPSAQKKKSPGGSIFDRLTDASKYTGAHKHRFDSSGRGRGLDGRDGGARGFTTSDLSQMTRSNLN